MTSLVALAPLVLAFLALVYAKSGGTGRLTEEENKWLQKHCGRFIPDEEESKVLHGVQTVYTNAPWVTLLNLDMGSYDATHHYSTLHCSGSLISPRHVLTAGHCLKPYNISCANGIGRPKNYAHGPSEFVVKFRVNCISKKCANTTTIDRKVTKIFHPYSMTQDQCYKDSMHDVGDIAVFELDEDVPYAADTYPACLSKRSVKMNDKLRQFGYGQDPSEKETWRFQGILKTYNTTVTGCDFQVAPDGACALSDETRMSCRGDSGSGMTLIDSFRHEIVAILTGGKECKKVLADLESGKKFEYKDLLVDVHYHKEWICNASGVCGPGLAEAMKTATKTSGLFIEVSEESA